MCTSYPSPPSLPSPSLPSLPSPLLLPSLYLLLSLSIPSFPSPTLCAPSKQKDTPIRRNRSKSIDDVQKQMVRTFISHTGAPRTEFPDPKVSPILLWMRACLGRFGRGSLNYSLLVFHKNNRFRKTVKRAVKSKYPFDLLHNMYVLYIYVQVLIVNQVIGR